MLILFPRVQTNFSSSLAGSFWLNLQWHHRHSFICPGWLWLIWPPNDQFVTHTYTHTHTHKHVLSFFISLSLSHTHTHTFSPPAPSTTLHYSSLFILWMYRILVWWKSVSVEIIFPQWSNRVTKQSAFDCRGHLIQSVHLSQLSTGSNCFLKKNCTVSLCQHDIYNSLWL